MDTKIYLFKLNYAERISEKEFIKDVLREFDRNTLVGCGLFVNNNVYNLEMILFLSFAKQTEEFENFLNKKYRNKERIFNYFISDIFMYFQSRGYNSVTFGSDFEVDLFIAEEANGIFLYPTKMVLDNLWKSGLNSKITPRVFISHSSKNKDVVDKIFNELQKSEIHAWYDKYEIQPGDSITEKINEGLEVSDIGIICISNDFLNSPSGWTKNELNFFIQRRMKNSSKFFIIINIDVLHDELPPLVQDYKYIDFTKDDAIEILINTLKKKIAV